MEMAWTTPPPFMENSIKEMFAVLDTFPKQNW